MNIFTVSGAVYLDSLFLQPTYKCAYDCKFCFVKQHTYNGPTTPAHIQINLLEKFCCGLDNCWANQVSISIDALNGEHMQEIFDGVIWLAGRKKNKLTVTINNTQSLRQYKNWPDIFKVDTVGFSNLNANDIDLVKQYSNVVLNTIQGAKIEESLLPYLHRAYLVMKKKPNGMQLKPEDLENLKEGIKWARQYKGPKFVLDRCLLNMRNNIAGVGKCSSGVSRFQVWPDGGVSGCPYAKNGIGSAQTVEGILENIRRARERYDFDRCVFGRVGF